MHLKLIQGGLQTTGGETHAAATVQQTTRKRKPLERLRQKFSGLEPSEQDNAPSKRRTTRPNLMVIRK